MLKEYEYDRSNEVMRALTSVYADYGDDKNVTYAAMALDQSKGFLKFAIIQNYGKLLERCKPETIDAAKSPLIDAGKNAQSNFMRMQVKNTLTSLNKKIADKQKELSAKPEYFDEAEKFRKLNESLTLAIDEMKKAEKAKKKNEE
jgi:hypothetical protein